MAKRLLFGRPSILFVSKWGVAMQNTRIQGALVHLVYLEARVADRTENPLREVSLVMIEDARQALLGKSDWPPDRIERLLDQILSGRFGARCLE